MKFGALILAAGASSRLGHPKQLVVFEGETLLDRSIRIAKEANCEPIVVVLGANEDLIRTHCSLQDVLIVSNARWTEGMGTSLSRGVSEFEGIPGVVVMTCDMPSVSAAHLRALASSGEVTASSYAMRKGVPAFFPRAAFHNLIVMEGDAGAREFLRSAVSIELKDGELDIDTAGDLADLQRMSSF